MITVSDEWKKLHEQPLLPETFVEIRLDVSDMDVTSLATITGVNQAAFSNTNSIINTEATVPSEQYALLEYNLWTLDGSKNILTDVETYQPPGFVSKNDDVSTMNIVLSEIRSAGTPGFRITWSCEYDEYATDFTIAVKQGNTVIGTTKVTDNKSSVTQIELAVADYDSVTITVNEWSVPEHRARIDSVTFGCVIKFDKNQILHYSHEQTGDPLGGEISKNSIEFSVDNTDGRWDLLNPGSLDKYLYERQPVTVHYGMQTSKGIEWIQAGVFYLTEWRVPSNGIEATFVARDAFDFLMNADYSRAYTAGVTTAETKVYSEMADIFDTAIETLPINTEIKIYEQATCRSDGTPGGVGEDGQSVYRIEQGWVRADTVVITSENNLRFDLDTAVASCFPDSDFSWVNNRWLENRTSPLVIPKTNTAEFVQKCVNVTANPMYQAADGIMYFDLDWSRPISDYVMLSDTAYGHPEVELTKPLKQINVVRYYPYTSDTTTTVFTVSDKGETITLDNPYMLSETAVNSVAEKFMNWWKHRGWVSGEFRADPRLELFDVVSIESKYGLISPVMITQIKYTYGGSFHGTYKGKILSADLVETASRDGEVTDS
jgi:hypothetical protein